MIVCTCIQNIIICSMEYHDKKIYPKASVFFNFLKTGDKFSLKVKAHHNLVTTHRNAWATVKGILILYKHECYRDFLVPPNSISCQHFCFDTLEIPTRNLKSLAIAFVLIQYQDSFKAYAFLCVVTKL